MAEYSTNEFGNLFGANIQPHETVPCVSQFFAMEILIAREERWPPQAPQQGDDVFIAQPFLPNFAADLSNNNAMTAQSCSLSFWDVLVKNVHAEAASLLAYSSR